jgi:hypothetical protein
MNKKVCIQPGQVLLALSLSSVYVRMYEVRTKNEDERREREGIH